MVLTESKIKKWGNSIGIVIPKRDAEKMDLKEGEEVSVDIVKKKKVSAFGMFKGAKPFSRDENALDR